eukprot:TRINITY_DN11708_c0_g1_i2.p1 TRINITY_DN11708_c0_g1~~TRINITY_DN11708_c0_g1_i2.p1  ORF type:complete len:734 (+),score=193.55 TRINITY_DN11708_c0_g1_i2:376-2577(+)
MATAKVITHVTDASVARITIVNPPVNALGPEVLMGLKVAFDEAHKREDVKAIVVTGSGGKFSGGADIGAMSSGQAGAAGTLPAVTPASVPVHLFIETIEAGPKPVVAAVDGLALGGGLELAMACHARLATPGTQLGLPELQLGIIPGFGGTQRLPRLVGVIKACEMMLKSKPIKAEEGAELGLVDAVCSLAELVPTAEAWALDMAAKRKPWQQTLLRSDKLGPAEEALEVLAAAREQSKKAAPHLLHPLKCLDAIEAGIAGTGLAGTHKEEEISKELLRSPTAKALMHFFLAQRSTSKVAGVTDVGLQPRPIRRVAVVGGGLMGSGIVTAFISAGIPVLLKEVNDAFLQNGLKRVAGNFSSRVRRGQMSAEQLKRTLALLTGTLDYSQFHMVDLVVEAVIESIPLKQQIFADLEQHCSPTCLLATNTSTIDLHVVGAKTKSQKRIIGAHFFSPAHVMQLLEIVRTHDTSAQAILDVLTVGKAIKKTPVVVGNCCGFAVNRVFFPYAMAATLLVDLGADLYHVDKVIKDFGMPMGNFRLTDLVGMGVAVASGEQFVVNFADRIYLSQLVPLLYDDKRLGESVGAGFYTYDSKSRPTPAPEMADYVRRSREAATGVLKGVGKKLSDHDIVEMIFFPVVNEACRVLQEGVVMRASDLDVACILSMGFPAFRGGLLFWADTFGPKYICERLSEWQREIHADFFKPSAFLLERAASGTPLSATAQKPIVSKVATSSRL